MGSGVARSAECNKVALGIIAVVAAKLLVVVPGSTSNRTIDIASHRDVALVGVLSTQLWVSVCTVC